MINHCPVCNWCRLGRFDSPATCPNCAIDLDGLTEWWIRRIAGTLTLGPILSEILADLHDGKTVDAAWLGTLNSELWSASVPQNAGQ